MTILRYQDNNVFKSVLIMNSKVILVLGPKKTILLLDEPKLPKVNIV